MAVLGDTLAIRGEFRIYKGDHASYLAFGDQSLYIVYADDTTHPSMPVFIVNAGLITGYYDQYLEWCPNFTTANSLGDYGTGNIAPNENFSNYFPAVKGFEDPTGEYVDKVLILQSGKVLAYGPEGCRAYASIAAYNANTYAFQGYSPFNFVDNSSDYSTRGHISIATYSALNSQGKLASVRGITIRGLRSTTNSIQVASIEANDPGTTNALNYLWDDIIPVPTPTPDEDPYAPGGDTGDDDTGGEGGDGDFTDDTEPIDIPGLPDETDVSAASTKFITLFSPSRGQLDNLANYMWGNSFDLDTFKKIVANPLDCILGLSIVPFSPSGNGSGTVTVGNISTGVNMDKCKQYKEIDCGSITVHKYWGAYLDYAPFTKAEIYLPYIGMRPLQIDDIMSKSVKVVYHIDVLSGACIAFVKCGNAVLYNFIGQCSQSIPISSNDWTNVVNGALGVAGAIGSMVATGGASAPYSIGTLASSALNALKPNIERSGALAGGASLMAIKKPYLVLTRPKQAVAKNQNKYAGYPTWITRKLSSVSGYTKVEQFVLKSTHATEEECAEIERLLKEGVYL